MKTLRDILAESLLPPRLKESFFELDWILKKWSNIVGDELADTVKPLEVKGDTLVLGVENPYVYHLIAGRTLQVLKKLKKTNPQTKVKKLKIKLLPGREVVKKWKSPGFYSLKLKNVSKKEVEAYRKLVSNISDRELKELFKSLFRAYLGGIDV